MVVVWMGGEAGRAAPLGAWRGACVLLLLAAALARCCAVKRAEMSPVPFVMGSRYGRSPPRLIAPRNDRFFMGSRYGKRSDAAEGEAAPAPLWGAPPCDCAHYVRHTQPRTFYSRILDAPPRITTED